MDGAGSAHVPFRSQTNGEATDRLFVFQCNYSRHSARAPLGGVGGIEMGGACGWGWARGEGGSLTKKGLYISSLFGVRLAPGVPGISKRSPLDLSGKMLNIRSSTVTQR